MSSVARLIYASRSRIPASEAAGEVQHIVSTSQRNNAAAEVTGMLLYHGGIFLQVLEGEIGPIRGVYGRVLRDLRHDGMRLVSLENDVAPLFSAWNMCARTISARDARILDLIGGPEGLTPDALEPEPTLNLLSAVAQMRAGSMAA